jgi:hypothetical protein
LGAHNQFFQVDIYRMVKPKRTRKNKRSSSKKRRGGGNCVSQENPWLTDECRSTGRTTHKSDDTNWDELIQALENENKKKYETPPQVANNTDWNAVIEAAKVANENNKRNEEVAANIKIAEYKAANPTPTERTIRRTFRVKKRR